MSNKRHGARVTRGQRHLSYPLRWVYVGSDLRNEAEYGRVAGIVRTASAHGLNGVVFNGVEFLEHRPPSFAQRLRRLKTLCDERRMELIPSMISPGDGGAVLESDLNLAEGLPVNDALFVVRHGRARFKADSPVQILNGRFEEHDGHRLAGFKFQAAPGKVSFMDQDGPRKGLESVRFENLSRQKHRMGRLIQEVRIKPRRCYRVSCWVKMDHVESNEKRFRILVQTHDDRWLNVWSPELPATTGWHKVTMGFNSMDYDRVLVQVGDWGAEKGRYWVSNLRIEEVALLNVLRRPGTPLTVRSETGGRIYREGRDYSLAQDLDPKFRFDRPCPVLKIRPRGRIQEGERLRVGYHHGISICRFEGGYIYQVSNCMSEPKVYQLWNRQIRAVHCLLAPNKYFLSMAEVRAGGSCDACRRRGISTAEILGNCVTRQVEMIRAVNPHAEVFIWSDMLDPRHNARPGRYGFVIEGDLTGSWKYIPKDIGIVCWYYDIRRESLRHFSRLGFTTVAGAYYDGDTLDNPKGWLQALDRTPGARGIMYTTWCSKYALLGAFGDLVSQPVRKGEWYDG